MARSGMTMAILFLTSLAATAQDPPTGAWASKAMGLQGFADGASAADGTFLYVYGGQAGSTAVSTYSLRRYDPSADVWTALPNLPGQVWSNRGGYHDGFLYSFGNVEGPPPPPEPMFKYIPEGAILRYEIASGTWSQMPPLLSAHGSSVSVAKVGGRFFVTGGFSYNLPVRHSTAVTEYDPVAGTTVARARMPVGLMNHASIGLESTGRILVFGGCSAAGATAECLEFDPAENVWTSKGAIRMDGADAPRYGHSAFLLDDRVYLCGGRAGGAAGNQCLEYRPQAGSWARRADLVLAREFAGAAAIGGKGYVFGGGPASLTSTEEFTPPAPGVPPVVNDVAQSAGGQGAATGHSSIALSAVVTDPDGGSLVAFEVQVKPHSSEYWVGLPVHSTGMQAPGPAVVTVALPSVEGYDWRWRAVDSAGYATPEEGWIDYNGNEVSPDFIRLPPSDPGSSNGGGCGMAGVSGSGALLGALVLGLAAGMTGRA